MSLMLWIALKLVSLYYQTQRNRYRKHKGHVVNCFKISIFVLSNTTYIDSSQNGHMLWIALKLVSLYYQTQHQTSRNEIKSGCELL